MTKQHRMHGPSADLSQSLQLLQDEIKPPRPLTPSPVLPVVHSFLMSVTTVEDVY